MRCVSGLFAGLLLFSAGWQREDALVHIDFFIVHCTSYRGQERKCGFWLMFSLHAHTGVRHTHTHSVSAVSLGFSFVRTAFQFQPGATLYQAARTCNRFFFSLLLFSCLATKPCHHLLYRLSAGERKWSKAANNILTGLLSVTTSFSVKDSYDQGFYL